jgi:hypothetical protein
MHNQLDPIALSLTHFHLGDSDDPLLPLDGLTRWRREATALYERSLRRWRDEGVRLPACDAGP